MTGIPAQLTFAVAASTGSGTDYHEINNLSTSTENGNPLTTLDLSASDDSGGLVGDGNPFNYLLTPSVDSGLGRHRERPGDPDRPASPTDELVGTPSGTGWDCSATNMQTNVVECTYTPAVGSPIGVGDDLPTVDVPAAIIAGAPNDTVTDTASVSSDDSVGYASASDTVEIEPSSTPLLDANVFDSDSADVPISSPSFDLTMETAVDPYGMPESTPPEVSSTLPNDVSLTATPTGTDWDCSASSGQTVSCAYTGPVSAGSPIAPGTSLPAHRRSGAAQPERPQWATTSASPKPCPRRTPRPTGPSRRRRTPSRLFQRLPGPQRERLRHSARLDLCGDPVRLRPDGFGRREQQPTRGGPDHADRDRSARGAAWRAFRDPSDPNWNCSGTNFGNSTVDCVYTPPAGSPIPPGTMLEPIVVPVFMTDTNVR